MTQPLSVAFLWHMHQPYYKDGLTGEYGLPWVRLHAAKDYVHMGEVLARHPRVHATFNFVPSLIEQLEDYARGTATDRHVALSVAEQWSPADKVWLLQHFFSINWDRFVRRYPRYWTLLQIRNQIATSPHLEDDVRLLSDEYWRDLVVWFNLAWVDPSTIARDPELAGLVERGRGFTIDDARLVIARHRDLCGRVVPLYRELASRGQVELTTSPYFHPILPLLVDTRAARAASPNLPLPSILFAHPEDAVDQLQRAVEFHEATFGQPPAGLWPSEGAVSPAVVDLVGQLPSFAWLATDEGILARSLDRAFPRDGYGHLQDPRPLYQPYRVVVRLPDGSARQLAMVFRDQVLSDRIGFVYQHWESRDAVADLIHRLERMADAVAGDPQPYLVTIALDGENCWETYPNNGEDFLDQLYEALGRHPRLRAVTVGEYLAEHPPRTELTRLATGSWIGANLETWIGEPEQNRAWDYLALARSRVQSARQAAASGKAASSHTADTAPHANDGAAGATASSTSASRLADRVWHELLVAEGSDWFWWYYSRNRFGQEDTFDAQFRRHLGNVYRLLEQQPPAWLERPILGPQPERRRAITGFVQPTLGAEATPGPGWNGAGTVEPEASGGTMQRGAALLRRLTYGYNSSELWLRLDGSADLTPLVVVFYLGTSSQPRGNAQPRYRGIQAPGAELAWELTVHPASPGSASLCVATGDGRWEECRSLRSVAARDGVVEVMLPLADLNLTFGDTVHLLVGAAGDGMFVETLPTSGVVSFTLTTFT